MDKQLNFLYDHAADVLHVSNGHPVLTDSTALNENVILQLDAFTKEIVGFSIVDFIKRFANTETPAAIPIAVTFKRIGKMRQTTAKKRPSKEHRLKV